MCSLGQHAICLTKIMKQKISKDPNVKLIPGKELGVFVLFYVIDLKDYSYVHLRIVNFYTDGKVARDYMRPRNQIK